MQDLAWGVGVNLDKWDNLDQIASEALIRETNVVATRALKGALVAFEAIVKKRLSGQRSGVTRRVSRTGRMHTASAPGESPAVLFGNLRNSIGHSGPTLDGGVVFGEVGVGLGTPPRGGVDPGTSYARRLELGGTDSRGVRILPRPYIAPAAIEAEPVMDRIVREALQ